MIIYVCGIVDRVKARTQAVGPSVSSKKELGIQKEIAGVNISAQTFTFRELAAATKNFRPDCFLGEGGFGRVYKGRLESTGQVYFVPFVKFFYIFMVYT